MTTLSTKKIGTLRKIKVELNNPVNYLLRLSSEEIPLNSMLGRNLSLTFTGNIYCIHCDRKISKTFQQGYCFPCYRQLLECNLCIIHPERCLVETGKCKDNWAHAQCDQSHIIYLANTSGLKIGITRETQVPARWIDQGAVQAVPLFKVKNRYRAGMIEVAFKTFVNDKTNWRNMLKNNVELMDLTQVKKDFLVQSEKVTKKFSKDIKILNETPIDIHYPVLNYPEKITSLSFDKTPEIEGELQGIKGQYLLFNSGVINLRKFGGYEIAFSTY